MVGKLVCMYIFTQIPARHEFWCPLYRVFYYLHYNVKSFNGYQHYWFQGVSAHQFQQVGKLVCMYIITQIPARHEFWCPLYRVFCYLHYSVNSFNGYQHYWFQGVSEHQFQHFLTEMVQRWKAPLGTANRLPVRDDWENKHPHGCEVRSTVSLAIHGFSQTCHKTGTTSGPSLRWIYLLSQSLLVDQGKALPPPDGTLMD